MRKTLMLLVLASAMTLAAPSGASAWHCHFHGCHHPCFSPCWGGNFGHCGFGSFGWCGWRHCCFGGCGFYPSFYYPAYYGYYAPPPYYPVVAPAVYGSTLDVRRLPALLTANRDVLANELARLRVARAPEGAATAPSTSYATVVISLPADAKLTANGQATTTTSDRRVFITPELQTGKSYSYVFKMTVERNGKTIEDTRRVVVRAGEESKVAFDTPSVATASK